MGVSLAVPDIFGAHKALTDRGVEFIAPPEKQPWGGVLAHLRDPDGNVITLLGGANSEGSFSPRNRTVQQMHCWVRVSPATAGCAASG